MPKEKRVSKRKAAAPAPYDTAQAKANKSAAEKKKKNPLFEKRPKNFGIGNDLHPARDLSRFVKWPKYVRLQRQRRILYARLKTPPAINQFSRTLDKTTATQLFKLLVKYRPETKLARKKRLLETAAAKLSNVEKKQAGESAQTPIPKKPIVIHYGINSVTRLVEKKKAKLVVIAHDVDPIELVVWLPNLCKKLEIPYCIVKGKSRLGALVGKKTCTALALVNVRKEDQNELQTIASAIKGNYNDRFEEFRRQWGTPRVGIKSHHKQQQKQKITKEAKAKEAASTSRG
jgi:large subunit ribosomal protein L7Ae